MLIGVGTHDEIVACKLIRARIRVHPKITSGSKKNVYLNLFPIKLPNFGLFLLLRQTRPSLLVPGVHEANEQSTAT